jgi:hypothetical protein
MRTCCLPNCIYPVFGTDTNTKKGYCKNHQSFRTDLKRSSLFPKKQKPKITTIKSKKEQIEKFARIARMKYGFDPYQWGFDNELEMFTDIWMRSNKKSVISGRDLQYLISSDLWYSCFAHILNKNHFKLYKLNPDNIMLIHPYEHYLIDHGTLKERIEYMEVYPETDFNIFYDKKNILKEEYNKIIKYSL